MCVHNEVTGDPWSKIEAAGARSRDVEQAMSRMNAADFASVRLIRDSPLGSPENDDRIRIYPLKDGVQGLKIKYYDGNLKDTHRSTFTGATLYDYVLALLKGVTTEDCDQFKNVQFNFPGFPTLMYSMEAVGDKFVRNNILDMTDMVWKSWEDGCVVEDTLMNDGPVGGVAALEEQLEAGDEASSCGSCASETEDDEDDEDDDTSEYS